jgi:hypothetical protein
MAKKYKSFLRVKMKILAQPSQTNFVHFSFVLFGTIKEQFVLRDRFTKSLFVLRGLSAIVLKGIVPQFLVR